MSLRELEEDERLIGEEPARQLAVARMAGFVRPAIAGAGPGVEPVYQPTALGLQIARRSMHLALHRAPVCRGAA